jgi:hypothetical protein
MNSKIFKMITELFIMMNHKVKIKERFELMMLMVEKRKEVHYDHVN